MFESAEIDHAIDKETYDAEEPALREALLEAQFELRQQLIGEHLEFRPQRQGALQVVMAQRVLFDTDKMQSRIRHGVLLEHLPGTQKIQTRTKTRFANDQTPASPQRGEALGQTVLFDKHVARFVQTRFIGEIHIIEHPRIRATLVIPVELGVGQYWFHGRLGNGKVAILADRQRGA